MFNRNNLLMFFPVLSFVWFTSAMVLAGFFYPDYNHQTQFISELGAAGSPHGNLVNYLGFIPTELFILIFVFISSLLIPRTKMNMISLVLISIYGISLVIAALFPCDFECSNINPSASHNVHMISAFLAYICGIVSIFIISLGSSRWVKSNNFRTISYFIGTFCIYAFLNLDPSSSHVGIFQRSLEIMMYSWFIYFAYILRAYSSSVFETEIRKNLI